METFRNQNHRFQSKFAYCKLFGVYAGVIFLKLCLFVIGSLILWSTSCRCFDCFFSLQFVNFYCILMSTTCSWNALGINAMFFSPLAYSETRSQGEIYGGSQQLDWMIEDVDFGGDWNVESEWGNVSGYIFLNSIDKYIVCTYRHYLVMRCAHHRHQIPRLRLWICFRYEPQLCNILQQCMSIYMHGSHSGQPSWFTMEIHRASSKLQICQMLVSTCRR